jgi:hypothetical protein
MTTSGPNSRGKVQPAVAVASNPLREEQETVASSLKLNIHAC